MITPQLPPDMLTRFPGLEALGRTTTRLHPRPGTVASSGSHVGGPPRWPAGEPWPVCDTAHMVTEDVRLPDDLVARLQSAQALRAAPHLPSGDESQVRDQVARLIGPGYVGWGSTEGGSVVGHRRVSRAHLRPSPMVSLAQLRASDIPGLPCPGGADLLQVLWCPFDHEQDGWSGPTVELRWRLESDVPEMLAGPPCTDDGDVRYLPRPCRLHPEQVVEYPSRDELPAGLRDRADTWGGVYEAAFMAPGWKVGGYASWDITGMRPMPCPACDGPTVLVLVIASSEYDGGTRDRWRPIEEQDVDWGHPDRLTFQMPSGVTVGRRGSLRVFACMSCPGTPVRLDLQ